VAGAAIASVLVIAAIALTGGDNSNDQGDEYVAAISQGFGTSTCVARATVDAIGLNDIKAQATPDEVRENPGALQPSEAEANNMYDNLSECPADKTYLIALASHVIGSDETLTPQTSECVRRQIDEDLARQILVAEFTGTSDTSLDDTAEVAAGPCLEPFQHVPESGPPGTPVELSGACTPPDSWGNGGVVFGMYDEEGKDINPGTNVQLDPDGSWQGPLPIPDETPAGTYHIWAHCYGDNIDSDPHQVHYYRDAEFSVTNP
jgi:hypothetical protein